MTKLAALVGLACAAAVQAEVLFKETFEDAAWRERWVDSEWKGEAMGEWEWSAGEWFGDAEKDKGLRTKDKARFYGISSRLDKPFSNRDKDLVVQYSVKNEGRTTSFCGGGYIKLMASDVDQKKFGGDTPYYIMFGPDLCGYDVSRIHLIFNDGNGEGKNLLKNDDIKLEYADKNEMTHLYTLHVRPDNTATVYFDNEEKWSGSIVEDWDFPKKMIDDPEDKKPSDWVDEEMMVDPEDVKPEGYDDIPAEIPDPDSKQPDDWDNDDDGEWEAPMIPNQDFKGPWTPKMIKNPDYKGPWKPKQIENKDYRDDVYAYTDIGTVGFELWIVDNGTIFDNIFVGDSLEEARKFADETWAVTKDAEAKAKEDFDAAKKAAEEEEAAAGADADAAAPEEEDLDAEAKDEL